MTDKEKIREVIEKRYEYWKEKEFTSHSIESEIRMSECQHLLLMINSLQEEPVSEDLKEAAEKYAQEAYSHPVDRNVGKTDFIAGAEWQIAKLMANATEVTVHIDAGKYPYIPQMELYDYDKDMPLAKEGDKYKVLLIKKE